MDVMDKAIEDMDVRERHLWMSHGRIPNGRELVSDEWFLPIGNIDKHVVEKYFLKAGDVTPNTNILIVDLD